MQVFVLNVKYRNAGLFILIDLSLFLPSDPGMAGTEKERALSNRLLDAGVFLAPGEEKAEEPGWFRLVFSQTRGDLEEGLRR